MSLADNPSVRPLPGAGSALSLSQRNATHRSEIRAAGKQAASSQPRGLRESKSQRRNLFSLKYVDLKKQS